MKVACDKCLKVDDADKKRDWLIYRAYPSGKAYLNYGLDAIWKKKLKNLRYDIIEKAVDRLAEYEDTNLTPAEVAELAQAKADGRVVVLPCKVGDMVWRLCKCSDIPSCLDGTMYSDDGSPGTATGYYCPYENNCPHDTDDCEKVKDKIQIFEDCAEAINISEDGIWFFLEYTPNVDLSDFGKTAFLSREAAEKASKECEK